MVLINTIIIALISCTIGAVLGFIYGNRGTQSAKRNNELQEQFQATEQELKQYRLEVTEHFKETSQLVDNLTEAYREVHNHMADAASKLTPTSLEEPLLKNFPAKEEIEAISQAPIANDIQAPLDYAPKTSSSARVGMLDETYGLDKEKSDEQETLTIKAD